MGGVSNPAYTDQLRALICERISSGQTLREICRDKDMPPESTVRFWYVNDQPPGFAAQYARARQAQMEAWSDELVDIAANGTNDWMKRRAATGGGRSDIAGEIEQELVPNHENINRSKLHADTKKWLMSKIAPKVYGDKLAVDQKTELGLSGSAVELLDAISANNRRIHDKSE
jgi:hypothetical protein